VACVFWKMLANYSCRKVAAYLKSFPINARAIHNLLASLNSHTLAWLRRCGYVFVCVWVCVCGPVLVFGHNVDQNFGNFNIN